jgi:hypothetical protein
MPTADTGRFPLVEKRHYQIVIEDKKMNLCTGIQDWQTIKYELKR